MSAYDKLYDAMAGSVGGQVTVPRIDLQELLAEVSALRSGRAPADKYTAEFEAAWTSYPPRAGNSKAAAFKAWKARLKEGFTALDMIEGTARYAAYVKAERTEQRFVKQAATFYGPGEHFALDWAPPSRTAVVAATHSNLVNEALRNRRAGADTFKGETIDV